MGLSNEKLLAILEDLLRSKPDYDAFYSNQPETLVWLGNAGAVIEEWHSIKSAFYNMALMKLNNRTGNGFDEGMNEITVLMNQARFNLTMHTTGPSSMVLPEGGTFDYFDEIRKVIATAATELFFVDPYLDAEFVSRYLIHADKGQAIRLLTSSKKEQSLLTAVDAFIAQHKHPVEVRINNAIHDRFLFIDKAFCFQSGSSFKDGAKKSPTTISQIKDAFDGIWNTYENMWNSGVVKR